MSNESGREEIYVRSFVPPASSDAATGASAPASGGKWQISTAGGIYPSWQRDGEALYYLGPDGSMMAAPITVHGSVLEPGTRRRCFRHGSLAAAWTTNRVG